MTLGRTERRLPTMVNFRDVGGLRTEEGYRIRPGRLFRGDSVQDITSSEVEVLVDDLGIRYIIDLRTGEEAIQQGRGPMGEQPVNYLNIPLVDVDGPMGPPGRVILDHYLDHLESDPNLPVAIEAIANAVRLPTLVHCAAGKDRTGVTLLMVELLVGVTEEDAKADFLVTAERIDELVSRLRQWQRYANNMARLSAEVYRCEEHSIDGVLEKLKARYGTAEQWALDKGVPADSISQLRSRLLIDS